MIACIGGTTPEKSAVKRADYSHRTQMTVPSNHPFTKTELGQTIRFEKMQKPEAESLDAIEMNVGGEHVLPMKGKFSGEFIDEGYTLDGVNTKIIRVVELDGRDAYRIRAKRPGKTTFTLTATNPAGPTQLEVDVVVT